MIALLAGLTAGLVVGILLTEATRRVEQTVDRDDWDAYVEAALIVGNPRAHLVVVR